MPMRYELNPMTSHRSNLKEILLSAAEDVALRNGFSGMTFEAVAKEAGVSKGGVLHHFGTKDKLIEAMVINGVERWRSFYLDLYNREPDGPGRMSRALLYRGFLEPSSWTDSFRRTFSVLLAAVVHDPSLSGHIREAYRELNRYIQNDGLPEGVGEIVVSVFDGVWLNWALGFTDLNFEALAKMRGVLEKIVEGKE